MKMRMIPVGALSLWLMATGFAAEPVIERAQTALMKGWSSAVILELDAKTIAALPTESQREALVLLAQAQLQAGKPTEALITLRDERLENLPAAQFWMGESEFAKKNYAAALVAYSAAEGDEAVLKKAQSLRALGRDKEAVSVLQAIPLKSATSLDAALELGTIWLEWQNLPQARELIDRMAATFPTKDDRVRYLRGMVDLQEGKLEEARDELNEAAKNEDETGALSIIGLSQVELASGDARGAEDVLEDYLRGARGSRLLRRVLENLDALYSLRTAPSSSDLRAVTEDQSNPVRARLAGYFLARNEVRLGRSESASRLYEKFINDPTDFDLKERALEEYANLLIQTGRANEAVTLLRDQPTPLKARFEMKIGEALASESRYVEAEKVFWEVGVDEALGESAVGNAALSALLAGTPEAENRGLQLLRQKYSSSSKLAELELWLARDAARRRSPDAPDQLQHLARINNPEASLHLAEWHFISNNPAESARELAKANIGGADGERAAYLAVFLTDTGDEKDSARARLLAEDFIKRYPKSTFLPEVEFKCGEILFGMGDYVGASRAFRKLALEYPSSPLAGRAWLEAGQAGLRIMTPAALDQARQDLEEAAKSDPSIIAIARFQQALVQNALNQPKEAVVLFDKVIETQKDPELKYAALIGKGDTLKLLGKNNGDSYRAAIATWNQVATDPAAPANWSNQARWKMGIAWEKLGDKDAALKSFYTVLSGQKPGDEEFLWLYKSGFDAARILEKQQAWREAIAVYEDLAKMGGPRSEDARNRVNRLRLDNLIWAD